jgi:hypothetical protein
MWSSLVFHGIFVASHSCTVVFESPIFFYHINEMCSERTSVPICCFDTQIAQQAMPNASTANNIIFIFPVIFLQLTLSVIYLLYEN